jgi:hypothetical protein
MLEGEHLGAATSDLDDQAVAADLDPPPGAGGGGPQQACHLRGVPVQHGAVAGHVRCGQRTDLPAVQLSAPIEQITLGELPVEPESGDQHLRRVADPVCGGQGERVG